MDDVCITFHVIANSSVRKKKKKQQINKTRTVPDHLRGCKLCPGSSLVPQHMLFPDSGHTWALER